MKRLKGIYLIFIIMIIWCLGSYFSWWSSYILPGPKDVIKTFCELVISRELFQHIFVSFRRIAYGFGISTLLGVPLGIIFGYKTSVYSFFKPTLEFIRHTPPLALVPMLILWFGIGEKTKIIVIVLASIFPILINTINGVKGCDQKLIEVGRSYGLGEKEVFRRIIFPSALPDILAGMSLAFGYSWRAIIGAEMIAASKGLGYMVLDGQQLSRPNVVIVGIIVIGVLGSLMDYLFDILTRPFMKWRSIKKDV